MSVDYRIFFHRRTTQALEQLLKCLSIETQTAEVRLRYASADSLHFMVGNPLHQFSDKYWCHHNANGPEHQLSCGPDNSLLNLNSARNRDRTLPQFCLGITNPRGAEQVRTINRAAPQNKTSMMPMVTVSNSNTRPCAMDENMVRQKNPHGSSSVRHGNAGGSYRPACRLEIEIERHSSSLYPRYD